MEVSNEPVQSLLGKLELCALRAQLVHCSSADGVRSERKLLGDLRVLICLLLDSIQLHAGPVLPGPQVLLRGGW